MGTAAGIGTGKPASQAFTDPRCFVGVNYRFAINISRSVVATATSTPLRINAIRVEVTIQITTATAPVRRIARPKRRMALARVRA